MEFLEENLRVAYPFADQVTNAITDVFADALIRAPYEGAFTLSIFHPLALTNAHVQIKSGTTIVLDTTVATVTTLETYQVLEGVDSTRGSSYRFILSSAKVALFAFLTTPVEFDSAVCSFNGGVVSTLNGLSGDVVVILPEHCSIEIDDQHVIVGFNDPADRVDCSSVDCEKVFTLNGTPADAFGSFGLIPDDCYRLVPHPTTPNQLLLFNLCTPCVDCDDVELINNKIAEQASYYHQLGAIYHDQFNRLQRGIAKANGEIATAETRGIVTPLGLVDIGGRAFNRPYFTQLALAIVNSTPYEISIALTVTIEPVSLSGQLSHVPKSTIIQRFSADGQQFPAMTDPGLPGSTTVEVHPQETVSYTSEMHQNLINETLAQSGDWHIVAVVSFVSGPGDLPAPQTIIRDFQIKLLQAQKTIPP